jgi:signal transduction histidine kinase
MFTSQNVVGALASGVGVDWGWDVYHEMLYWAVWAALTPAVVAWARRHRVGGGAGWRPWAAHAGLATVIAPAHIAAAYGLHAASLVAVGALPPADLAAWLAARRVGFLVIALTGFWKYGVVVGVYYAFDYYRRWRREREQAAALAVRAARLEAQLASSRLAALRSRLRPHFLFNTLNTVAVLVREAPREAEATIRRLSGLLRQTLERDDADEVPLSEELDFLERYLEIQRTRHEERLRVEMDVDPGTLDAKVPFLVLQPLVENAVEHGVGEHPGGGIVTVGARRDGERLHLWVEDRPTRQGGPGGARVPGRRHAPEAPRSPASAGTALADLRERLRQLYGDDQRFEAGPRPDGGFSVRIEIPARSAAPSPAEEG